MASETIVYPAGNISKAYKYQTFDTTRTINGHSYNCLLISNPKSTFPSGEYINPLTVSGTNHKHYYLDLSPYFGSISYITWDSHLLYPDKDTWYIIHSTARQGGDPSSLKLRVGFTTSTSWPATTTQDGGVWTESINQSGNGNRNMIYKSLTTESYRKLSESNIWNSYTRTSKKYLHFRMWNGSAVAVVELFGVAIYGMAPNTTPNQPTIIWPAADNTITYNKQPYFKMKGTDEDSGDKLTYYYKIGNGSYTQIANASNLSSGTEQEWQYGNELNTNRSYTLSVKTQDSWGAQSAETSRQFTVGTANEVDQYAPINTTNITDLQQYITNVSNYYNTGSSITLQPPYTLSNDYSENRKIKRTTMNQCINKLNLTPKIGSPQLSTIDEYTSITADQYNSLITKLRNG